MDSNPLISVVVPVFNTPHALLDRAMRSLLGQSQERLDIILVDDGSDRPTADACDSYAAHDNRVRVIHKDHDGVSVARNAGIEASVAEWIMFVDSDDEVLPDVLDEALSMATLNRLDILYATAVDDFDGEMRPRSMGLAEGESLRIIDDPATIGHMVEYFIAAEIPANSGIPKGLSTGPWARLFNRRVLASARFLTGLLYMEDMVFNSTAAEHASRVGLLDHSWYFHHANVESVCYRMDYDARSEQQASIVRRYVTESDLPLNLYYSWVCTYFFFATNFLSRTGQLNYKKLASGYALPWFYEAFKSLDTSKFSYKSRFSKIMHELGHKGHLRLLLLYYKLRGFKRSKFG